MNVRAVSAAEFKLPKEFLNVLVVVMALCIQYVSTMYFVTMRARITIYRRKFMSQFDKIHNAAFPDQPKAPEFGYPDSGNGYYSKKLPYSDWFNMNNAQRCQVNFLEHLTYAILLPIIVYPSHPTAALNIAIMVFIGRLIFTLSYSTGGPGARLPGALIMDAAIFIGYGFLVSSMLKIAPALF